MSKLWNWISKIGAAPVTPATPAACALAPIVVRRPPTRYAPPVFGPDRIGLVGHHDSGFVIDRKRGDRGPVRRRQPVQGSSHQH